MRPVIRFSADADCPANGIGSLRAASSGSRSSQPGTDISLVLENDISTLLLLLENFFVWPSSAPRYGDAQNAFDKIRELLKEMRQRYPLEPA
jgi:hypothetical protein